MMSTSRTARALLLTVVFLAALASASPAKLTAFAVTSYARPPVSQQQPLSVSNAGLEVPSNGTAVSPADSVSFTNCESEDYRVYGEVKAVWITPCVRDSPDESCIFYFGSNYTIELDFVSELGSDHPRSSLVAGDSKLGPYAYSGQGFDGCLYAHCPIIANTQSTYVYHFQTLKSSFDSLSFNVTQSIYGPSMFCARTEVRFQTSKTT